MTAAVKILAFAGSTRSASFNKKLVQIAAQGARNAGAEVTVIDLRDYPLPVYDGDLERDKGIPAKATELKELFLQHSGLLLACPEYNGSITAVLKNTLDWVSRPVPDQAPLACFKGKVVSLMSASPGALGGLRGLVHARAIMANLGCIVLPEQLAISRAADAFADNDQLLDQLLDQKQQNGILALGASVANLVQKIYHN